MSEELANAPVENAAPVEAVANETPAPSEAKEKDEPASSEGQAPEGKDAPKDKPELSEADKVKYGMQKRIDRQTAKLTQAERELQELRQRVSQYEQPKKNDAPKEDDFETVEDYLKAVGKYEAQQEFSKAEKEKAAKETEAKRLEVEGMQRQTFEARAAELRKTAPDFDDVASAFVEEMAEMPPSEGLEVAKAIIRSSKLGADLTYHLGKNPELAESLKSMDSVGVARTLFRAEYDLEKAPKKKAQPAPNPPTASKGSHTFSKGLESMSAKELVKWASS